jgi:plastocyanin
MATVEVWIQLENHAWDMSPHNTDRMTGQSIQDRTKKSSPPNGIAPVSATLVSPETGVTRKVTMFNPLSGDALIYRRYKPPVKADKSDAWTVPDDRKVNPWDLNEPDPTDKGTMGTIPGVILECNVGDRLVVHFRNKDTRAGFNSKTRSHSMHPHGITFPAKYDGAYPLSPEDTTQPLGAEATMWNAIGVTGNKKGDRVPAPITAGDKGGTFDYTWDTHGWPATAGVWLYHDHSFCDMESVERGAIGLLVIHNTADALDVVVTPADLPGGDPNGAIITRKLEQRIGVYIKPAAQTQFLQLYHTLMDGPTCVNGRQYLGNTPTLVAGPDTKMRFGVVGMGSMFHTFHLHGHRWVVPGPDGTNQGAIQSSIQDKSVSQFEDTRIFGPANSFGFTIQQGSSFMGAFPGEAIGEWHMHCHVMMHMDTGMMGSLLVVDAGQSAVALPHGEASPCDTPAPVSNDVAIQNFAFTPQNISVKMGDTVTWTNKDAAPHTVTSNNPSGQNFTCAPVSTEVFASPTLNQNNTFQHTFNAMGTFDYHCEVHGCAMSGSVTVTM